MDVYDAEGALQKGTTEETVRPPLVPSEKNIAVNRKPRTRDVPSRYKAAVTSPSLSTPAVSRRYSSPNVTRTLPTTSPSCPKRPHSAERRCPSTPPSPPRPSTPVDDVSAEMQCSSRRLVVGGRTSGGLWPSTMRSLCVSFQSDTFSLPISKKEKPVTHSSSDHTLKSSSATVANRHTETPGVQRKATPERKRTSLRGKNTSDQLENSKPTDNSHANNHQLPRRMGVKMSSSTLNRSIDLTDRGGKTSSLSLSGRGISPLRRIPVSDGMTRGEKKSQSEVAASQVNFYEGGRTEYDTNAIGPNKPVSSTVGVSTNSSGRASSTIRASRSQSLPTPGPSRPPSPSRTPFLSSTPSRGMLSPSRTRPSSPFSVSSVTSRSSSSSSVLSFIADVRKGKKGANHIEEAHQVRLLYNKYMQWRYVNTQSDAALSVQKLTAEKALCNVWNTTAKLRDSVTMKRIDLWLLKQELKLNSVLNQQMDYLDDWALMEREHSTSVSGAIEALEACTLRLPVAAGAKADIHTLKSAICSAVDMMQAIASVMCSLLPRVEGMNRLVSELANVKAYERAMLDECGDLLASAAVLQVEESSLRTHLIQLKQALPMEISQSTLLKHLYDPPGAC